MQDPDSGVVRWRLAERATEMVLAWEGEDHLVFFDALSGDTHMLSAFAMLLAETLKDDSLSQSEILKGLLGDMNPESVEMADAAAILGAHIPRLEQVGFLLRQAS